MRTKSHIIHLLKSGYYFARDPRPVEIGEETAYFDFHPKRAGDILRWRIESETELLTDFLIELEEDDVVWDVGAGIGHLTGFAIQGTPNGQTIAFEPYPANIGQLGRNCLHNGQNYSIFSLALSDATGVVELDAPENPIIGHGSSQMHDGDGTTHSVRAARGDDIMRTGLVPEPDIIKIDVEGAEAKVLAGMQEVLAQSSCRVVYTELHLESESGGTETDESFRISPSSYRNRMESLGLTTSKVAERGSNEIVKQIYFKSTRK